MTRPNSVFMGDGINDAPALTAAPVGIAFGHGSEVTTEAAGVVILDSSLERVDELLHIGRRMRSIALQSAIGRMALSVIGMFQAASVSTTGQTLLANPSNMPESRRGRRWPARSGAFRMALEGDHNASHE